jgi:hypothetical protein
MTMLRRRVTLPILLLVLSLPAAHIARAADAFEPNDSFAAAQPLAFGSHVLSGESEDWFVVANITPGFLRVDVPLAGSLVNVFLWSPTAPNPAGVCTPQNGCLSAGPFPVTYPLVATSTIYVQVIPVNPPAATPYTLTVANDASFAGDDASDDDAGNDSITTAVPQAHATFDLPGRAAYDADFYAIPVLPGQLSVCLEFEPAAGNIDLELYDSSFQRIELSTALTNDGCVFGSPAAGPSNKRKLERGIVAEETLYIGVRGTAGNAYRLSGDLPTQWITRLDYGPIHRASITLADLDGDGLEEILVGTSKGLDAGLNEVVPAALVVLEHDGTERWHFSPPAMAGPDPSTGLTYQTSSVSSTPAVADVDDDGQLDVVIGAGADTAGEGDPDRPGQPGDLGAVYAVDGATGLMKWMHLSDDRIGTAIGGEGIPDGVFGTPVIADIDGGRFPEVIYGGWDQRVWILDGATGVSKTGPVGPLGKMGTLVFDTVWSSPALADVDEDGFIDILVGSDQSTNPEAGTRLGGVFHVLDRFGVENIPGFDAETNIGATNPAYDGIYGKWEEQTVWSSPAAADFDGDEHLEIAYGTSFFGLVAPTLGRYIRVWNHDGTLHRTFVTSGQTFASPLFADLTGDGTLELIGADMLGRVYAWSRTSDDVTPLFSTLTLPRSSEPAPHAIVGSPLAVDLNGDGSLEILYMQAAQVVVVNADGIQLSDPTRLRMTVGGFEGSPAVGDVDRDRVLDVIAAGTVVGEAPCNCIDDHKSVVFAFRWDNGVLPEDSSFRFAKRMFRAVPEADGAGVGVVTLLVLASLRRIRADRDGARLGRQVEG